MKYKCEYCGKEYRFAHSCYEMQSQKVKDCYEKPFREAVDRGRRMVVVKDAVFSADGIGKHIEAYSISAEKYGYAFKSETHFPDSVGIACSFIFEKIIQTASETNFVNCEYCKSRYDANQYFKCPQCSSPAK